MGIKFGFLLVLAAQAGGSKLVFDLRTGITPDYGKPIELRSKLVRFAANSLSWSKTPLKVDEKSKPGFAVVETSGGLEPSAVEFIRKENPYDCTTDKSGPIRPDWFASMFENTYYPMLGFKPSQDFATLAKKIGVPADLGDPKWKRMVFGKAGENEEQESRIAVGERAILVTEGKNGPVWLTIDHEGFPGEPIHHFRINNQQTAGELIFTLPNGMQGYSLVTQSDGQSTQNPVNTLQLAYVAPLTLVKNNFATYGPWASSHFPVAKLADEFPVINLGSDCMTCHRTGIVGPRKGMRLDANAVIAELTKRKGEAKSQALKEEFERDIKSLKFFDEDKYTTEAEKGAEKYVNALHRAEAFVGDPKKPERPAPLLPDFRALFQRPVTLAQAAAELETDADTLLDMMNSKEIREEGEALTATSTINRFVFGRQFCKLKAMAAKRKGISNSAGLPTPVPNHLEKDKF